MARRTLLPDTVHCRLLLPKVSWSPRHIKSCNVSILYDYKYGKCGVDVHQLHSDAFVLPTGDSGGTALHNQEHCVPVFSLYANLC